MIIIYFIPILYNKILIPDFQLSTSLQLAWLTGTFFILFNNLTPHTILGFFKIVIRKRKLLSIYFTLLAFLSLIAIFGTLGLGHYFVLPMIGLYCFVCLMTIYCWKNRRKIGLLTFLYIPLPLICFVIFFFLLWGGFGRLILAQFILIGFFFASYSLPWPRFFKLIFLVSIPIMISVGGVLRSHGSNFSDAILEGQGLGSIIVPVRYAEYLHRDMAEESKWEKVNGESYVATLLFFIPRSLWENKPVGFGRQMALWYFPKNRHNGFTLAGTHFGEAFGNFGKFGIPVALFVFVFLINLIKKLLCSYDKRYNTLMLFRLVIGVILTTTISDFLWGGSFTSFSRVGVSVMFVLPVLALFLKTRISGKYNCKAI